MYYKIWVDAIKNGKKRETGWEIISLLIMSVLQGMNLLVLLFLLHWLTGRRSPVLLPSFLFHARPFNIAVTVLLTFLIPFVILNYLLIFYNKRYLVLLQQYPDSKGKLYRNYALISFGLIVVPLVFKILFL